MLTCIVDNNTCVNKTELFELLKQVVDADIEGVVISKNLTNSRWKNHWGYDHSIFFILTTLTTIGRSLYVEVCGSSIFRVGYG